MSYSSEVLADAPLGYWRLAEASGTTMLDSSGNGRHGTYVNPPTLGTVGLLVGDSNTAATFDGANDVGSVANASWMNLNTWTIEALIKPNNVSATQAFMARSGAAGGSTFSFAVEGSKLKIYIWASTGGVPVVTGTTTLVVGTKYHVAATSDGTTVRLYLNGALEASLAVIPAAATSALSIGTNGDVAYPFWGVIDEAAFYGTALSATRIAAHYNASITAPVLPQTITIGQAVSTNVAQPITKVLGGLAKPIGQALSANTANSVTVYQGTPPVTIGQATEAEAAQPITPALGALTVPLGQAVETETAAAWTVLQPITATIGQVVETDTARPIGLTGVYLIDRAGETDTAQSIGVLQIFRTDLTYSNEGYNYDGEADVFYDPPPTAVPAGIRLAPIRRAHQSLPAPTLVNGRPT